MGTDEREGTLVHPLAIAEMTKIPAMIGNMLYQYSGMRLAQAAYWSKTAAAWGAVGGIVFVMAIEPRPIVENIPILAQNRARIDANQNALGMQPPRRTKVEQRAIIRCFSDDLRS